MKKSLLALALVGLMSITAQAAVLRLSTSNVDANAGNSLNMNLGTSDSMWVWVSTSAGQRITGLSTNIESSVPAVLEGTGHVTENPGNLRWQAPTGEGTPGDLIANTNAFVLFPATQTGINTGDENVFVLHSRVDFTATDTGTTALAISRGTFDIVEGVAFTTVPDSAITFGTGLVTVAVPEPGALSLVGLSLLGCVRFRRRRS